MITEKIFFFIFFIFLYFRELCTKLVTFSSCLLNWNISHIYKDFFLSSREKQFEKSEYENEVIRHGKPPRKFWNKCSSINVMKIRSHEVARGLRVVIVSLC